ncbi:Pyridoxal phosphate homeostasis protein [Novipirellula aureliae]|uniref:Pyridoxal phosphate homeostasis protein n=1 Tax=Novipirellula aureliae TaxID=2527966 RepID=A0A5C6E975_9BACT|nr:YggS family pyridoxal phosphate-dependent enzyme [Novipirellula aureliae]TWU43749.1 Pyridoxal phosphate homeostasis protein [Novipirellula aureliae]
MIEPTIIARLRQNWQTVRSEVAAAAVSANREPSAVQIIGVSKYVDAEATLALVEAGCNQLGENRPQLLWKKNEQIVFPNDIRWHLIGHIQRNKLRRSLPFEPIIHSVDSPRLLAAIAAEAVAQSRVIKVLVEVNISGDEAKTGLSPEQVERLLLDRPQQGAQIIGMMAMAGWGSEREEAKIQFSQTRQLRDDLQKKHSLPLPELSMGMSGDFNEAIAEGATMVRIGSRLFEGCDFIRPL